MEANNIITQIQSLKKQIGESQLTVIEIDLVKKQLLECYELLFSGMQPKPICSRRNCYNLLRFL
jgi:hypothetical protein